MPDTKVLYAELKPAIEAVAIPLFDFSKRRLRDRGNFLPHAAVLDMFRQKATDYDRWLRGMRRFQASLLNEIS